MLLKYLLLLGICGLCHATSNSGLPPGCASTNLWGRQTYHHHMSSKFILPRGQHAMRLQIPDGNYVCLQTPQPFFVGEIVVACDHEFPPSVEFENGNPNAVLITRYGHISNYDGTAQTLYYCDYEP